FKNRDSLEQYVNLIYDENGESVPSKFFIDFNIDMDETDEDTIEKEVYKNSSNDISNLLKGCSYEDIIIPKVTKNLKLKKTYNAVILIYNFEYNNKINSANNFDFITSINYE
ncbi:immunity 22 family protein, partial [Weizmannia sp. CD-2023]|uniref:immunity 22 family protein n=1 Tax=Weizmannia sp. CD-2023 TaxID=3037263 RepID=UPI002E217CC2|nr:immunity 22 family protein [Weizmannia sp. CD-2023]